MCEVSRSVSGQSWGQRMRKEEQSNGEPGRGQGPPRACPEGPGAVATAVVLMRGCLPLCTSSAGHTPTCHLGLHGHPQGCVPACSGGVGGAGARRSHHFLFWLGFYLLVELEPTLGAFFCVFSESGQEPRLLFTSVAPAPGTPPCVLCVLSLARLFAAPWTVARQAPLSMGFSRQGYWGGLPFPPPGDLPHPGIKSTSLMSPAVAGGFYTTTAKGEPLQVVGTQ